MFFFFFKQKTAYELRISDWSSDVCSSDLQVAGGVDQRQMRKRLREIAELAPVHRVVFLGQQADVIAQAQQPFEQSAGFRVPAEQDVIVGEPETAGEKGALAGQLGRAACRERVCQSV